MTFRPSSSLWGQAFAVPSSVVDKHIKLCSGLSIKVLLLILRYPDTSWTTAELASRLGQPRSEISDALSYLLEKGLLEGLEQDSDTDGDIKKEPARPQPPKPKDDLVKAPNISDDKAEPSLPSRPRYPREEIISIVDKDKALAAISQEAQSLFGKLFTSIDFDILVALYSYYALSPHYILTLLHYCKSINKVSMAYAEKVAASWISEGVDDSTVDSYVDTLMNRKTNEGKIKSAFGIYDRSLTSREREYIHQWFELLGFGIETITYAYEITVERTGKITFSYLNKILLSWKEQGITNPKQIKKQGGQKASSAHTSSDLDRRILEQFINEKR